MKKVINGYSIDENLFTGAQFYGELGNLIGVFDFEGNNIAIIQNPQGGYTYRETVIDVSASMTQNGPVVSEQIFMGETEKQIDKKTEELITTKDLDSLGNGEINIDLGLQQSGNSIFVAKDELLEHLKKCKRLYPELPLNYALKVIPYEKNPSKTI